MNASLSCREWLLVSTAAAVSGVAAAAAVTLAHSRKESAFGGVASAGNAVPAPRKRMSFWKCLTRLLGSSDCCAAADVFDSKGGLGEKSDGDAYLKPRPEIDEEERLPLVNSSKDHILGDPIICNVRGNADASDPSKRKSYLSWDDYFMAIAFLSAERSKDPNRQVGACLVSQDRVILGIGYNGFPRGCSDDELPWAKMSANGDPLQTKYPYVCHAEVNAILNKNHASAAGQRLYVTMFPCNECAKIIIQAGVAEVVYYIDKIRNTASDSAYVASRRLLSLAGVKFWQHQQTTSRIVLEFS
eukprot:c21514_g1_i2 orf=574-1476(-)